MCDTANDRDPRAALAETIRRKTDNGNDVVDYLLDVLHERLDGVKHLHRERAASILTEYGDLAAIRFMEKNRENRKTCKPANRQPRSDAEDSRFDAALAQVIRDKTNEAEDIADYLIDTMNGIDSAVGSGLGKIAHRHRVAAAIELLRRGFDYDRARSTAVPAYAGTRQDDRPGASRDHARAEPEPEIADEPVDYVAMAKEIVANLDPFRIGGRTSLSSQAQLHHVGNHQETAQACHYRRTGQDRRCPIPRKNSETDSLERVRRQDPCKKRSR